MMFYEERVQDIFDLDESWYLAQFITADFIFENSINREFDKVFDIKKQLDEQYPECSEPDCILIDRVFNLVTRESEEYLCSPYDVKVALEKMRDICKKKRVSKLAITTYGSWIDGLSSWNAASNTIKMTFKDLDIDILICL